jgi:hypothetical protein
MNSAALTFLVSGAVAIGPVTDEARSKPVSGDYKFLERSFDLTGARSPVTQRYLMESRLISHKPNGTVIGTDIYKLKLECDPAVPVGSAADRWTCLEFTIQLGDSPEVAIPSLSGWSYLFSSNPAERDRSEQTLGIPHEPFDNLIDATDKAVPPVASYHVYNAFIDFHSFTVFAERTSGGQGIQDLNRIGQRVIHSASHSRPAVNLGGTVAPGSYFENGEVTLELKGVSLVQGRPCAILGFDSGQSSFLMIMKQVPEVEVRTVGSSHYWGDIYKDLESQWVRKAALTEMVVSETMLPGPPNRLNAVVERSIDVLNITGQP